MKRNTGMLCVALVLIAALALSGMAQARGRWRGSGNGMGMGMGMGMRSGSPSWQVPGVDATSLTQQQRQQIVDIRKQTRSEIRQIRMDSSLTLAEKKNRISEVWASGHDKVLSVLTAEQREAFTKFNAKMISSGSAMCPAMGRGPDRWDTMRSWRVPGVSDSLLTQEQRKQIISIRAETRRQVRAIRMDSSLTASDKEQRIMEARKSGHDKVMDLLTTDQKLQFKAWPGNK